MEKLHRHELFRFAFPARVKQPWEMRLGPWRIRLRPMEKEEVRDVVVRISYLYDDANPQGGKVVVDGYVRGEKTPPCIYRADDIETALIVSSVVERIAGVKIERDLIQHIYQSTM